jgi:small GTP-binding protein
LLQQIVGNTNAGKTTLFYKLQQDELPQTVTSMVELDTTLQLKADGADGKSYKVIDFPGHRRVRGRLTPLLNRAAGIVFVVDSTSVAADLTYIAEFMMELFLDSNVRAMRPPLLVLCNKSELAGAKSPKAVKPLLEKELAQLQETRSALEETNDDAVRDCESPPPPPPQRPNQGGKLPPRWAEKEEDPPLLSHCARERERGVLTERPANC